MLLSVDEFKQMLQNYLKFLLGPAEVLVIREYFEDRFSRKEIKRTELKELLSQEWPRRYKPEEAQLVYQKLKKPFGTVEEVMALFRGAVEKEGEQLMNMRNFKKALEQLTTAKQGDKLVFGHLFSGRDWMKQLNSFAHYLEKENNGFISLKAFVEVDHRKYEPEYAQVQEQKAELFTYSTYRDIVLDIKNVVQTKELNLYDLFDEYDRDKSYLLGTQEIALFCQNL